MIDDTTRLELRDTIRRVLSAYPDILGLTKGKSITAADIESLFSTAGEHGWLSVATADDFGGLGLGMEGATVLAAEIGRSAAPGPFLANGVLLPSLVRLTGDSGLADSLSDFATGKRRATIAVNAGFDGDPRLIVDHAEGATDLLVVDPHDGDGGIDVRLLPVPPLVALGAFDPASPMASVSIPDATQSARSFSLDEAAAQEFTGAADLWIAAEMVGTAERASEIAVAHAKERRQFGAPIGSYQGVKHRIVDDYVLHQNAAAVVLAAARAWDAGAPERLMLSAAARAAATEAALNATAFCVQVHGGMGFSWEHPAHLYYKRARRLANLLGSQGESLTFLGDALCAA